MEAFKDLLNIFDITIKNTYSYDEDWFDKAADFNHKLEWFECYTNNMSVALGNHVDEILDEGELDDNLDTYISDEKFPVLYEKLDLYQENMKCNIFYSYISNYGSSAVCTRNQKELVKSYQIDKDYNGEYKNFVNFWHELGKKVCIIHIRTHDKTHQVALGTYEYYDDDDDNTSYKFCVSV
jgi:hypothetical protein